MNRTLALALTAGLLLTPFTARALAQADTPDRAPSPPAQPAAPVGEVHAEARAKLKALADNIRRARSIQYEVIQKGEGGMLAAFLPIITGNVTMARADGPAGPWNIRRTGKVEMMGKLETEFLVVTTPATTTWVDHREKKVFERPTPSAASESIQYAKQMYLTELAQPEPLARELGFPTIKLESPQRIDGQMCDVIYLDPGEPASPSRWFLSQADGLPRKVQGLIRNMGPTDATSWFILDIKIDAPVDNNAFTIDTPAGYTRSTAETPATPPPAAGPDAAAQTPTATATQTATTPRTVGGQLGNEAPDFELAQADGTKLRLSSLRGNVVIVDFWGTWCLPCRQAAPILQKIYDEHKASGLRLLALSVRERDDNAPIEYMKEKNLTYTLLLRGDDAARAYGVKVYPTYFVVGRDGTVLARIESITDLYNRLSKAVNDAINPPKPSKTGHTPAGSAEGLGDDAGGR